MDTHTLTPPVAAATLTSIPGQNRNLSTNPKRMAVLKVWDAMMRGARKYCEGQGFVTIHNMPRNMGLTGACENTDTLFTLDWYDGRKMFLPQRNQRYIEMLTQAVEGGRVCGEIQSFRKELKAAGRRLAQFPLFGIEHLGGFDELLGHLAGESAGSAEREYSGAKLEKSAMLEGPIRQGMKLEDFEWCLRFHEQHDVKPHSGAGVGMARVAQFILGQADMRACVPFLINRENVI